MEDQWRPYEALLQEIKIELDHGEKMNKAINRAILKFAKMKNIYPDGIKGGTFSHITRSGLRSELTKLYLKYRYETEPSYFYFNFLEKANKAIQNNEKRRMKLNLYFGTASKRTPEQLKNLKDMANYEAKINTIKYETSQFSDIKHLLRIPRNPRFSAFNKETEKFIPRY
jgi:hypothetical protein